MLLVIAYSPDARTSLRNICRAHEESVVRQFGRVALFTETEFAAFQTVRLREKHDDAIQVERTRPFNEFAAVRDDVIQAAKAYEDRNHAATPYNRFANGRELPTPTEMKSTEL